MSEGKYIENIGCTECGSSDAVGVYQNQETGEYYGICFSCDHKHKDPYGNIDEEFKEVKEAPTKTTFDINTFSINPLKSRGISELTCKKFGVKSKLDATGNDEIHAYPHYLQDNSIAWCTREVQGKKFKWAAPPKSAKFFGQDLAGSGGKMIIVTEGACDALAVCEMLAKLGKAYRVVSIVNGASAALKDFKTNFEWISTFENIFLAFDMDEPGQTAAKKVAEMFPPNKVKTISYQGAKDPNELLLSGRHQDFLNAIFSAKETKPDGIVSVEDIFDEAIKPPVMGLSWPWESLTEVTYGYRRGELYGIGGGSGCGKSMLKGTKVRLSDGSTKKVEDVVIGDGLLNDVGERNTVLFLGNGIDDIYEVSHSDGTSYFCNSTHILSVIDSSGSKIDIPINNAIKSKEKLYGYNGIVEYPNKEVCIPPYILGIWLGDGHNDSPSITCGDEEVLSEWSKYGESIGLIPTEFTGETNCRRINLSRKKGSEQSNTLYSSLKQYDLPFNKHIPKDYLLTDKISRLELLAGLLDTDGYLRPDLKSSYEFTTKYSQLGKDVSDLARSLGFRVKFTKKTVNGSIYDRLAISGNLSIIPCRVPRKSNGRYSIVDNNPNVLSDCSRIISIKNIGKGEYYGFGLTGNKRFCLDNYIVTHNTEFFKECINRTINHHGLKAGVIFLEEPATKTLKVLAGKKVNKRFHIPSDKGGDWTVEELVDGINDLKGKVYLYNHFGAKDWDSIKSKIRFMVSALDIKDIYLDHLTALVAQEDNEYKALNKLMEEMSSLCQELDCTIFYVSHLRKASGTPHEEGGRVTADQFKGSGAIVFWSNFLIGLERNQQAEDEEERNTTTLRVLKDRNTGLATGTTFQLRYDHDTGRWGEIDEDEFQENF